jgi:hypothetical protein
VLVVLVVGALLLTRNANRHAEREADRMSDARQARARIVEVGASNVQEARQSVVVRLRLEVIEPASEPRGVTVAWEVQQAQLGQLIPGAELPVRVDSAEPDRIHPGVGWASWSATGLRGG